MVILVTALSWKCCSISLGTHDQILQMQINMLHPTYSVQDIFMNLH